MWVPEKYIRLCQTLKELNLLAPLDVGMRAARGFADVGFELYTILTGGSAVSHFSGERISLESDWEAHFFPVPEAEELVEAILIHGGNVVSVEMVEGRSWKGEFKNSTNDSYFVAEADLLSLLGSALLLLKDE